MILEYLEKEKLINDELNEIIADKNRFIPEFIKKKIDNAVNIIIDIDTKIKSLKVNKFKKICFSILKIFTFGKINKNKILHKKITFLLNRKEKILKNIKKLNQLYIRKSKKNIEIVDKVKKEINSTNLLHQSSTSSTKSKSPQM